MIFYGLGAITTCELLVLAKRAIGIRQFGFSNTETAFIITICCLLWPIFWLGAFILWFKEKV